MDILAIWNTANKGKTEVIRDLANLTLAAYPNFTPVFPNPASIPSKKDFRLIVKIKGKRVAFESQGDPNTNLNKRLLDLAHVHKCALIICSTRTSGMTVQAVEDLRMHHGFDTIWSSTYQVGAGFAAVNSLTAKHLLELLQMRGLL